MDDIVKKALVKWPNVPDCRGWLGLDARGNWWLRDAQAQASGNFLQSKGVRVEHPKLRAFIERNYEANEQGEWFFQNGPQRVFVELECTPMVWRVDAQGGISSHVGHSVQSCGPSCWVDEQGRLYLLGDGVLGIVHTQDMVHAASQVEAGCWHVQEVQSMDLPKLFGFVRSPQQAWVEQAQ